MIDVPVISISANPEPVAEPDDLGRRLVSGLAKLGLATRHRAWSEAGGLGLTPTQGQILSLLRAEPERPLRVTELAEALAIATATTTVAVQALERKGLVQKSRSMDDGRARAISLTAEGQLQAALAAGWSDFLLTAAEALTPGEQEVFLRALTKMIRTLQVRGEIPVSRMCVTCRYFRPNVHEDAQAPHHCALVDAPFGDRLLRLDCPEHEAAPPDQAELAWKRFITLKNVPDELS